MKIVVTGVAGFIGSHLAARLLAEGHAVTGIDDLSQGLREQVPAAVDFHPRDVRAPDLDPLFRGADAVFHLAARNCIADCQADPVATASVNVLGTVNVFETARRCGVRRILHAESSALYEGIPTLPTDETRVAPQSVYAVSKQAASLFADAFRRWHDLEVTAFRYFCVYGPGQDYRRSIPPVMSAFIMRMLAGERPVVYGDGSKRRDFVHVDDVNDFHMLALQAPRTVGQVYNVGTGRSFSVREILDHVARLLGVPADPVYGPDQPGEATDTLADVSRARALGWAPRVELDDGLRGMIDYLRPKVRA